MTASSGKSWDCRRCCQSFLLLLLWQPPLSVSSSCVLPGASSHLLYPLRKWLFRTLPPLLGFILPSVVPRDETGSKLTAPARERIVSATVCFPSWLALQPPCSQRSQRTQSLEEGRHLSRACREGRKASSAFSCSYFKDRKKRGEWMAVWQLCALGDSVIALRFEKNCVIFMISLKY